ncbi:MAG: recombinase family protein [Armatimonadota bacterium]|nr:recombinase family protein [bacterium]
MRAWRLKERLGYRLIADRLTELEIPTPSGKMGWSASTVYSLIGEKDKLLQYAGYSIWNRRNCQDEDGVVRRSTSEWVVTQEAHPAIISKEECEDLIALARQVDPQRKATKPISRFALSSGPMVCAHCGSRYAGAKRHGGDYYACGAHLYRRGAGCGRSWYIPKEQFETLIFEKLLSRLSDDNGDLSRWIDEVNQEIDAEWEKFAATSAERRKQIADLEKQMSNLLDLAASGTLVPEMEQKIKEISDVIARLKRLESVPRPSRVTVEEIRESRDTIVASFRSAKPGRRKAVLSQYVVRISVDSNARVVEAQLVDPRCPKKQRGSSELTDDPHIQFNGSPEGIRGNGHI